MEIQDYAPNSKKSKQEVVEKAVVERNGTKELKMREPSVGKKIFKTFVQEDLSDIADVIIHDYIIPGIKECIRAGIDIALGGDGRVGRGSSSTRSRNSYDSYYNSRERDRRYDDRRRREREDREHERVRLEDLIYDTRGQAEDIRSDLIREMKRYESVSISTFWDVLIDNDFEVKSRWRSYTDNDFGWFDLGSLKIDPVRGGYIIHIPRPVSIITED